MTDLQLARLAAILHARVVSRRTPSLWRGRGLGPHPPAIRQLDLRHNQIRNICPLASAMREGALLLSELRLEGNPLEANTESLEALAQAINHGGMDKEGRVTLSYDAAMELECLLLPSIAQVVCGGRRRLA